MTTNLFYALFRGVVGILHSSVWSLSLAAYYLVLGLLRAYLSHAYKVRKEKGGLKYERKCYRSTAWLLFLLNIPMSGMTALMILTDSGFSYPGYVIYLSAIYTFYISTVSVVNLVRYRKLGSPVLSAAKVLNVVAVMMSVLGLQTAMISSKNSVTLSQEILTQSPLKRIPTITSSAVGRLSVTMNWFPAALPHVRLLFAH